MTNKTISISFGAKQVRIQSRVVIALVFLALFTVGFFTIRKVESEVQELAKDSLEKTLRANAESLLQWLDSKKNEIMLISKSPEINKLSSEIVTQDINQQSKESKSLDERLLNLISKSDYEEYYILNNENVFVASSEKNKIGVSFGEFSPEVIESFENNEPYILLPSYGKLDIEKKAGALMAVAFRLTKDGVAIGTLAFKISPEKNFTRVLKASRAGESAETYAVNSEGMMISNSRFIEDLQKQGLVSKGETSSVLKVKVDTKFSEKALKSGPEVIYPNVQSDVRGYDDYREELVIGAWTYLKGYDFAIVSEVDYDEAYQSLSIIKLNFRVLLGLALLLGIGVVIYSRKSVAMQEKISEVMKEVKELGQYHLKDKLGEGGMGIVYKATHKLMHRETALKLLRADVCGENAIRMFEKEVQLTCQLCHPNTISIYDYGKTEDGKFYYVMEFLDGMDLDTILKKFGPFESARAIYLLKQICLSLKEAHEVGLVHRDIKAQNIMVCCRGGEHDVAKVLDFGLVREVASSDNTMDNMVCGTPKYISPEAISTPAQVDGRADLYSLGIMMFYMMSGEFPFNAETPTAICVQHVTQPPPKVSDLAKRKVPEDLENIIHSLLEKEANDRPQSAIDLYELLDNCQDGNSWIEKDAASWWDSINSDGVENELSKEISNIDNTVQISMS